VHFIKFQQNVIFSEVIFHDVDIFQADRKWKLKVKYGAKEILLFIILRFGLCE